jgi:hypothetical protein
MKTKLKSGTVGPDGKIFWRYHKRCKNGEHWVTPEQYQRWRFNANRRDLTRYRDSKQETTAELRERRADTMRRYRARLKEVQSRQVPNPQFRESSSPYAIRSYAIGLMRTGYPPPPDTYPHHLDMIRSIQAEPWWEANQNDAYPFIP